MEVFEIIMSYKDIEKYNEAHPHHEKLIDAPNIVSGVSITGKVAGGFKDVLSRISDAHPSSPLADNHGRKSIKQAQTERVIEKHFNSGGTT
jgi:hypothetical protein